MYQDLYIIHLESQHSLQYILQELGHRPLLEPKTRAERGQAIERSAQVLIQPARLKRNRIFMNSRDRTKGPKVVYASSHSLLVVEEDSSNEMRHDISFCVEGAYLIASSSLKREKTLLPYRSVVGEARSLRAKITREWEMGGDHELDVSGSCSFAWALRGCLDDRIDGYLSRWKGRHQQVEVWREVISAQARSLKKRCRDAM
ncbi:hypothetical protein FA13DRAFT_33901 [Coprinellus micaceus]|uniref:Uncharacterized protein n=1 Tax=Coprinellus micaceus TaxID=71717 RepID=A0A4Y7U0B8_COPMI|nr:hypothetical protein FA13DRAFT_33901 [Coprinellus micaceus]